MRYLILLVLAACSSSSGSHDADGSLDVTIVAGSASAHYHSESPDGYSQAYIVDQGSEEKGGCKFLLKTGRLHESSLEIELETDRASLLSTKRSGEVSVASFKKPNGPFVSTLYPLEIKAAPAIGGIGAGDWRSTAGTIRVSALPDKGGQLRVEFSDVAVERAGSADVGTISGTIVATYDGLKMMAGTRACPDF